jgi:hypothetical protein
MGDRFERPEENKEKGNKVDVLGKTFALFNSEGEHMLTLTAPSLGDNLKDMPEWKQAAVLEYAEQIMTTLWRTGHELMVIAEEGTEMSPVIHHPQVAGVTTTITLEVDGQGTLPVVSEETQEIFW